MEGRYEEAPVGNPAGASFMVPAFQVVSDPLVDHPGSQRVSDQADQDPDGGPLPGDVIDHDHDLVAADLALD